jgi:hypothetical protein
VYGKWSGRPDKCPLKCPVFWREKMPKNQPIARCGRRPINGILGSLRPQRAMAQESFTPRFPSTMKPGTFELGSDANRARIVLNLD